MSRNPLKLAGALVIEIGGVLLALAVLPSLPWQQWKSAFVATSDEANAFAQTTLPPARFAFQMDGQPRLLEERSYSQPREAYTPVQPAELTRIPPPDNGIRKAPALLPSDPQRGQYVAETLDRASQRLLDSLVTPWNGDSSRQAASREQASLRPELPHDPGPPPSRFDIEPSTERTRVYRSHSFPPTSSATPMPPPPSVSLEPLPTHRPAGPQLYGNPSALNAPSSTSPPPVANFPGLADPVPSVAPVMPRYRPSMPRDLRY